MIMRTDPRADEVRSIVEQVFADYRQSGRQRKVAGLGSQDRFGGRFPRIYEPRRCEPEDWEPGEDFGGENAVEIDETILIDAGRYVARSYRSQGYLAMWLVAVGILQFYDDRGRMLTTVNLFESLRSERMAA